MPAGTRNQRLSLLLLVAAPLVLLSWFWWQAVRRPEVRFLPGHGPAAWLVYPSPVNPYLQPAVELEAVFKRTFDLSGAPRTGTLRVAAFGTFRVAVNGTALDAPAADGPNW
jgi:hypothetical protein